jgi:hypothetical protein
LSFNDQSVGSMNDTTAMGCFDGTQIFSFSSAPSALTQVSGIISAHDSQEGLQGLGALRNGGRIRFVCFERSFNSAVSAFQPVDPLTVESAMHLFWMPAEMRSTAESD